MNDTNAEARIGRLKHSDTVKDGSSTGGKLESAPPSSTNRQENRVRDVRDAENPSSINTFDEHSPMFANVHDVCEPSPSDDFENPTIACHHDEKVVQYPPSPCCGEPIEPDEEGIGVCLGCGRRWQWARTSWHHVNLLPADPFDRARLWLSEDDVF